MSSTIAEPYFDLPSVNDEPAMVEKEIVCAECEGAKTVERLTRVRNSDDPYEYVNVTCPKCEGEGVVMIAVCEGCGSTNEDCGCWGGKAA